MHVEIPCAHLHDQPPKHLPPHTHQQVAASPDVRYVSVDDIPSDFVEKEKALEAQKEDIMSKPENVREKMVEGRIAKTLKTLSLMDAPYIKDPNVTVSEHVKSMVAKIGENIKIRRFDRCVCVLWECGGGRGRWVYSV